MTPEPFVLVYGGGWSSKFVGTDLKVGNRIALTSVKRMVCPLML